MLSDSKLIYVHDPMCSWCWGYAPTWMKLKAALQNLLTIEYRVGGLAPDSDSLMPDDMQVMLKNTWHTIANKLGTDFNFDFWSTCLPRRSTYPACRAALIARKANKEPEMVAAIQEAYYLNAKNPSDESTLAQLAQGIGLSEPQAFEQQLHSLKINIELMEELKFARSLPIQGFPSLVLLHNDKAYPLPVNYTDWQKSLSEINQILQA